MRDVSHGETEAQSKDVDRVLSELGLGEEQRAAMIEVWNKSDLLDAETAKFRSASAARKDNTVLVSARAGDGLATLLGRIEAKLAKADQVFEVSVKASDGAGLAWLHERTEVLARKPRANGDVKLTVRLTGERLGQAQSRFGAAIKAAG